MNVVLFGQFRRPTEVCVGSQAYIFAYSAGRIKKPKGRFLLTVLMDPIMNAKMTNDRTCCCKNARKSISRVVLQFNDNDSRGSKGKSSLLC